MDPRRRHLDDDLALAGDRLVGVGIHRRSAQLVEHCSFHEVLPGGPTAYAVNWASAA